MILRNRSLVALLSAEIVSTTGSFMTYLALPWFVLVTTGSATKMGFVLAAELLPVALLGIPSGTLVGKLGARTTMLLSDALRAPVMASIPVLHALDVLTFPLLLGLVAVLGALSGPFWSAQRLILPELFGEDEGIVAQANSVMEGAQRLTALLGPALAGVLIGVIGSANVLYVDAATFLSSFLVVAGLVRAPRKPVEAEEAGGMLAGLRYVLRDPLLGPTMIVVVFSNMAFNVLFAALCVLGFEEFHSARITGAFFAANGAGAVIGSVIAFKVVRRFDPLKLAAYVVLAGEAVPFWFLGIDLPAIAIMAVLFVSAVGNPLVNAPMIGVLTMRTPPPLRAKVMTAVVTFATIAGPLGLVGAGPLLEAVGARPVFLLVAATTTVTSLLFAWIALRQPPAGVPEAAAA